MSFRVLSCNIHCRKLLWQSPVHTLALYVSRRTDHRTATALALRVVHTALLHGRIPVINIVVLHFANLNNKNYITFSKHEEKQALDQETLHLASAVGVNNWEFEYLSKLRSDYSILHFGHVHFVHIRGSRGSWICMQDLLWTTNTFSPATIIHHAYKSRTCVV